MPDKMGKIITVNVELKEETLTFSFDHSFSIGRDENNDLTIPDKSISRFHAQVNLKEDGWWFHDLKSTNGSFFSGNKIEELLLKGTMQIVFGAGGLVVTFKIKDEHDEFTERNSNRTASQYYHYYFEDSHEAGEHTMMVRELFKRVKKKWKRVFSVILAVMIFLLMGVGGYAWYQHTKLQKQYEVAEHIFYQMKELEVAIASQERDWLVVNKAREESSFDKQLQELSENYDELLEQSKIYSSEMSEEERLILRVAHIFGECEITMPPTFKDEVFNYIKAWQNQSRITLETSIQRAVENEFHVHIANELLAYGLPPQLFYIALQESNYKNEVCGPYIQGIGVAKGMWQFMPEAAVDMGLRVGHNINVPIFDPNDERHDFWKSTNAAARYLKFLYSGEAQASGLLVLASYNWGATHVRRLVKTLNKNPKDRNFWQLVVHHREKIPDETYNYVLRIFSAAVIGEQPELFGFDFTNPLQDIYE